MIDVIFPKRQLAPRERDNRPVATDYRPKQLRAISNSGVDYIDEDDLLTEEPEINLRKLETALTRDRLTEIAILVRTLTYGEMMELARAIWKIRPDGSSTIDQNSLPMMLHLWSAGLDGTEAAPPAEAKTKTTKAARTVEGKTAEAKLVEQ